VSVGEQAAGNREADPRPAADAGDEGVAHPMRASKRTCGR
jgi:hypothetical protein